MNSTQIILLLFVCVVIGYMIIGSGKNVQQMENLSVINLRNTMSDNVRKREAERNSKELEIIESQRPERLQQLYNKQLASII